MRLVVLLLGRFLGSLFYDFYGVMGVHQWSCVHANCSICGVFVFVFFFCGGFLR
jgi:hypothetical protein